jgi:peptide/nickel transport system substrate-binding protein
MRSRIIVGAIALAAVSATLLAGCSSAGKTPTPSGATSATLNLYQHPQAFNPLKASQGAEVLTEELVFDNLVQASADFKFEPRLASSWEMSPDGMTWTFHLRKNLKWSDGKSFSSDDVVWSFNTYADPKVGSAYASKFTNVEGYADLKAGSATSLSGITAPDANTVVIKFAKASPGFLASIVGPMMFILPKHVLESADKASLLTNTFFNQPDVGMGPYTMTKFTPDQEVDLKKNPNFRDSVGIDKLYLKMLTSDVAEAQLQTGELDLAQVAPADLSTVQGMQGVKVSSAPSAGFLRIVANDEKFPAPVRQALLTAIDRKTLITSIYGGKADLVNSSFLTKWALPSDLDTYDFDADKAKSMLQAAGFDFSKSYTFEWVAGTADRDQAINVILQEWQSIGVNIKAKQVDGATQLADIQSKAYDFTFSGGGTYTMDPATSLAFLLTSNAYPAGGNVGYYSNPEFDAIANKAAGTVAQSDSAPLWKQAATIENKDVAEIWLYNPQTVWATSSKLQNFAPYGDFTNAFADAYKWKIGG